MISVIICSRTLQRFEAVAQNIKTTIGVPYEIIRIENAEGKLGITAAYNQGALQSQYSYLCFVHEDVSFQTQNWGMNLIKHFEQDKEIGLIGIAGGIYKRRMIAAWAEFETETINIKRMNFIQRHKSSSTTLMLHNPLNEIQSQVVTLDGVFLCTRKEIWAANKFDETLLKGFHGYDLDFCISVGRSKKLFVVYDILLEHFSEGTFNDEWYLAMLAVHKKWARLLPLAVNPSIAADIAAKTNLYNRDWNTAKHAMEFLVKSGYGYFQLVKKYNSLFSLINAGEIEKNILRKDYLSNLYLLTKMYFVHLKRRVFLKLHIIASNA